jgi:hypothetical protein
MFSTSVERPTAQCNVITYIPKLRGARQGKIPDIQKKKDGPLPTEYSMYRWTEVVSSHYYTTSVHGPSL